MTPEILAVASAPGVTADARIWPASSPDAPVMLIWPAMGTAASYYTPFAQALWRQDTHAVVMELRGVGASSVRASRRTDFGYRDLVEQDLPAAFAAVRRRFPAAPVYLLGHSLGGQVSALYASRQPEGLAGLILIASGSIDFRAWSGLKRWGILAFTQFAAALGMTAGYFPGKRVGFGGCEARTLMRDWARVARTGRFAPAGAALNYEAALAQITLPVLGITFEHDAFAPRSAQQSLLAKMSKARVTQLHLHAADTEGVRIDHYRWVRRPEVVIPRVMAWLGSVNP